MALREDIRDDMVVSTMTDVVERIRSSLEYLLAAEKPEGTRTATALTEAVLIGFLASLSSLNGAIEVLQEIDEKYSAVRVKHSKELDLWRSMAEDTTHFFQRLYRQSNPDGGENDAQSLGGMSVVAWRPKERTVQTGRTVLQLEKACDAAVRLLDECKALLPEPYR